LGSGSNLLDVGGSSIPPTGMDGIVFTFELTGMGDVVGDFGSTGQWYGTPQPNPTYLWYGFVGPNPISYGQANYVNVGGPDITPGWGSLPVISVVPEPSTIALLAIGSFMILRRKR